MDPNNNPSLKKGLYLFPLPLSENSRHSWIGPTEEILLRQTRLIFAENERTARRFISSLRLGIRLEEIRIERLDKDTSKTEVLKYAGLIQESGTALLMSEAGCPAIADPGSLLADVCHQKGIQVFPLAGPSSLLLALMASGLSGQHFAFHGYLPVDPSDCAKKIRQLEIESRKEARSQILIETPYRNAGIWNRLLENLSPDTRLCFASGLGSESESIAQKPVREWRKLPAIEWKKIPAVFIFMAG